MSDLSADDEDLLCGNCEDADNFLQHLEVSPACRDAIMKEKLPRRWWIERYLNDKDLLLLDLSIVLSCCLNTGGCPLRKGIIERSSRHPWNNPECLRYYKLAPVFLQLNVDTENLETFKKFLGNRKRNINRAKAKEDNSFSKMMESQMTDSCQMCGLQGPVMSGFEVTRENGEGQRKVCSKPLCEDLDNQVDFHPRTLAFDRGNASRPIEGNHEDHLAVFHDDFENGYVLAPAQMVELRAPSGGNIDGDVRIIVLVPNSISVMGKGRLQDVCQRAAEDWDFIKPLGDATLAPRTLLLDNFGQFVQACSVLHRVMLAAFRKCCLDKIFAKRNIAKGTIKYSPNKTDATFRTPSFRDVAPNAIEEKFPWSDAAEWARQSESDARSAINGRVKTKVRVRLLSDSVVEWSPKLKSVMVRSFEREVTETADGVMTVTCAGPCDPGFCGEDHKTLNEFLAQRLTAMDRLARIPLVLNYLKAKVECFQSAVLVPLCYQYDMKIQWDKESWCVYLIGHLWTTGRKSLNEKVARKWFKGDIDIIRRTVQRQKDMETVSLDALHIERR